MSTEFVVFSCRLPWPLLREVRRAGPISPGLLNLVSPREAAGSLQAPTAALLVFTFRLVRYGDPTHTKRNIIFKLGFLNGVKILPTEQPSMTYLEKEEAWQRKLSFLFSNRGQIRGSKAEDRSIYETNLMWQRHGDQMRFMIPFVYLYWNISRKRETILNLRGVRHGYTDRKAL